ncbi:hypothetical protein DIE04_26465 [Burkholderia sp. Bp8994]|nr:hypothetical protein DIE20_30540 [Burkholderia sp. Bp9131]RQR67485.1 hypothetical protein DIE12_29365 [Burkholderia sp. Bp9015]RQR82870.1 hypothetical protein DIE10_14465 [Burkholderia sp. Bp9011]RQR91250.1 hypothetical protein DIE04_26465 [Burkholderia sp. Bp8994]RQR93695.1 hypothetical protein DIE09_13565 [Burkholderia sp. Bp9010]RQR98665.1 hypothetical protein DIE02_29160 [Burkholderia sp. Bp8991]RQS31398.1 hypothetical protein DIE05_08320 [Burkholderia sp. Bp8995]RQS34230.1 hypothetic
MRDGTRTRCHRNVSGHFNGRARRTFQSVVESKSRILLSRGASLAYAPDPVLRSPFSPFHGSSMSVAPRSPSILAAIAAGARAAGLKLKKRHLD